MSKSHPSNPFMTMQFKGRWMGQTCAADRLYSVAGFTLSQCNQALALPDLQRTVVTALERRVRRLKKAQG